MQPNDQNPTQPPQPEQPPQNQPVNNAPTGRVLQPLSSEESIRSEAHAAQPSSPTQASETPQGAAEPAESYMSGGLITEPIQRTAPPVATPTATAHQQAPAPQKDNNGNRSFVFPTLVGLIAVAVLASGVYFFFFKDKVGTTGLVGQTVQKTSYLRPKEWEPVPAGLGLETYSDVGEGSKAVSAVTVNEVKPTMQYFGNDRPDNWYEALRKDAVSKASVDMIRLAFRNGGKDCTSDVDFKAEPDMTSKNGTVGLALSTGECTREDGKYTVKMRTVVGEDDAQYRHITVAASNDDWMKSKATFEAMLDSVGQVAQ